MSWLNNANLLQGRDVSHTSAAVLFSGVTTGKPKLAASTLRWFFTTDMAHCRNLLTDLSSPKLKIYGQDIQAILSTLGVQALKEDYGQANKGSSSSLAIAPRTEVTQASDSTHNPALTVPSGAVPTEKKSLSGIFKTAAAVGGIFLTLAVISQIYPSVGQSRTPSLTQNQYASTSESIPHQTAFAPRSPNNESAQPITTAKVIGAVTPAVLILAIALRRFEQTGEAVAGSTEAHSAGNGSIMRLAPIPMFYFSTSLARVEQAAAASSITTHGAIECVDACRLLAGILQRA